MQYSKFAPICLLPDLELPIGPVTTRRFMRLICLYLGFFFTGLLFIHFGSARLQALGLGLLAPGAGFLQYAGLGDAHGVWHLVLSASTLLSFALSLLNWFAVGNAVLPPLIWLGSAIGASLMLHSPIFPEATRLVPLTIACGFLLTTAITAVWSFAGRNDRREANAHLMEYNTNGTTFVTEDTEDTDKRELSVSELSSMRFLLDRALQPVSNYYGFEWYDQFQTAAVRYQLNFAGYALSMAQATHLPALDAYLGQAQQRLIEKQTDQRIWNYWAMENIWGNLDFNPDPIARDNIMFTGFCAAQIAMFHAASGRRDYQRNGSFTLRGNHEKVYSHSLSSLVAALDRDYRLSQFHLIACEPNWIYPLCNTIGAAAMLANDKMTCNSVWSSHCPRFRQRFDEEFVDPAGRIVPCRSNYTGFALPPIGGAQPQALPCFFLNAIMPDIAMRQWLLLRRKLLKNSEPESALDKNFFWRIDTGNYGFSRAAAYSCTALAAAELGDRRVARLCMQALDDECPVLDRDGARFRPAASVWAHAVEFLARMCTRNAFHTLINAPRTATGITIAKARYPDVMCAAARSEHGVLSAVFYPGDKPGPQEIGLSGLAPGAHYNCDGAVIDHLVADPQGCASLEIVLAGRTLLRVGREQ